eukprot:450006_1
MNDNIPQKEETNIKLLKQITPIHGHTNTLNDMFEEATILIPSVDFDNDEKAKQELEDTIADLPPAAFNIAPATILEDTNSKTEHTQTILEGIYQGALESEDVIIDTKQAEKEYSQTSENKDDEKMEIIEQKLQIKQVDVNTGEIKMDLLKIGSTIRYQEMKNDIYPNTATNYEMQINDQCEEFTWTNCDAKSFKIRSGNYFIGGSKEKRNSQDSLYDLFAVDVYQTPVKLNEITQYINLYDAVEQYKDKNKNLILPPLFIVNLMIPGQDEYNNGINLVFYAKLSDKTKQILADATNMPNSIRYLNEFINDCDALKLNANLYTKESLINRFKVGARIMNLSHTTLGFLIKKMIPKKTKGGAFFADEWASFYHEPGKYFGLDVDAYNISGTSKSGLNSARPSIDSIVFDLYFYLGAKQFDETPEHIISCCRISKLALDQAAVFPVDKFGITVPERSAITAKNADAYNPKYDELFHSLRYDFEFRKFSVIQFFVGVIDLFFLIISFVSIASLIRLPTYVRS